MRSALWSRTSAISRQETPCQPENADRYHQRAGLFSGRAALHRDQKAKPVFDSWMTEQLADCSADEAKIIKETVVNLKKSLRKVYGKSSKYRYD